MRAYVLTPLAARDLTEIWDHIAADNLTAARRVMDRLDAAMRKLSRTPGIGHFRQDLCDGRELFFLVYSYLIVVARTRSPYKSSAFYTLPVTCATS
jgi:plasmid stabilization system protein ParE